MSEFGKLKAQKDSLVAGQLERDMKAAYCKVAEAYGWDQMSIDDLKLLLHSLFNYFVMRLP